MGGAEPMQPGSGETGAAARRPIAERSAPWAVALAARLARGSITPNQISLASVAFAAAGAALIGLLPHPVAWLAAAACIQLRLLCNLLDGMVAIEGGKQSAVGPIYNDAPDRIADSLVLVATGYAVALPWLGWAAALLAVATAYVRVLGGSVGLQQSFAGIMSKRRRMDALTLGLAAAALESWAIGSHYSLAAVLAVIAAGSLWTCATRTAAIARELRRA